MKRNYMMRFASLLLALVLVTCCVVSGTFAKYTTSGNGKDEARVAKWGVVISVVDDGDSKIVKENTASDTNETHISTQKELKLLAPGTKGDLVSVKVTGQPEVSVKVTIDFSLTLTGWNIDENTEYMPLVFTAKIGADAPKTYKIGTGSGEYKNITDLINQLETDIEKTNNDYQPDTLLENTFDLDLSWEWAFNTNDTNDTILGNLKTAPTLNVSYTITVEQID